MLKSNRPVKNESAVLKQVSHPSRPWGFALPTILLVASLLLALAFSDAIRIRYELSANSHNEKGRRAQYAAQAGLNRALSMLTADGDWEPALFSQALTNEPSVSFEVKVKNNRAGISPITAPDGTIIPG